MRGCVKEANKYFINIFDFLLLFYDSKNNFVFFFEKF